MKDKKIISAIINRDERMLAFVVRKYSKLLWKIAASILINAASIQDVEECVADVFIYLWQMIAALGQTGTATGPILSFAVTIDGEAVDPLTAQ